MILSDDLRGRLGSPFAGVTDADVLVLARLTCTPPLVPYSLLRRLRRGLLPNAVLDVEARLCASPLVDAVGVDGYAFGRDVVPPLRDVLRSALAHRVEPASDELAQTLRAALDAEVADLSPLLQLEERLCWMWLTESDPGERVDSLLADVVLTVVRERRMKILVWAAGALARLPPALVDGSAAWTLAQLCRVAGLPGPQLEWPAGGVDQGLLAEAAALLPETVLGLKRDGTVLSIGSVSRRRRIGIAVPDVIPYRVTVTVGTTSTEVIAPVDGGHEIDVGAEAVTLRDLRGRTYTLPAFDEGQPPPEEAWADGTLDQLETAWKSGEPLPGRVLRMVAAGRGLIVALTGSIDASVFVPTSRAGLTKFKFKRLAMMVNSDIHVRIIDVDRAAQQVIAARTEPPWKVRGLTVGDRVVARVESIVDFGAFLSFPAPSSEADADRLSALLHISEIDGHATKGNKKRPPQFPFARGDEMEVEIAAINHERRRISVTRKPWLREALGRFEVGQVVRGRVAKVVPFGLFVQIAPGIDGLVHQSLLSQGASYEIGAAIHVRVIDIDLENSRVVLALA